MPNYPGPSNREKYWQELNLIPTGITPGSYATPTLTVNEFGFITAIESTALALDAQVKWRQAIINVSPSQFIGTNVGSTAIVKRIVVSITTPYTDGGIIRIEDNGASIVYMAATLINAQLVGSYDIDLPSNTTAMGVYDRLRAVISGAPAVGGAVVFYEYFLP